MASGSSNIKKRSYFAGRGKRGLKSLDAGPLQEASSSTWMHQDLRRTGGPRRLARPARINWPPAASTHIGPPDPREPSLRDSRWQNPNVLVHAHSDPFNASAFLTLPAGIPLLLFLRNPGVIMLTLFRVFLTAQRRGFSPNALATFWSYGIYLPLVQMRPPLRHADH
jgi:hypothetical protein